MNRIEMMISKKTEIEVSRHSGEPRIESGAGAGIQSRSERDSKTYKYPGLRFSPE
jgi:hypothetical protein